MLNKLKFEVRTPVNSQPRAQFTKRKSDQAEWTAGVFLRARSSGERVWLQRIMINGNPLEIQLGTFPLLSLTQAREAAEENKQIIASGVGVFRNKRQQNQQDIRDRIKIFSSKTNKQAAPITKDFIKAQSAPRPLEPKIETQELITVTEEANSALIETARALGPNIDAALTVILDSVPDGENFNYVPEDMLALCGACGPEVLDWACKVALDKGDCTFCSIVTFLDEKADTPTQDPESTSSTNVHGNIRGAGHFH